MPVFDKDMTKRAQAAYLKHEMHEAASRSFLFKQPGTSNMLFRFTWVPGSISITGDIGEIQVVHHHALWEFESGIYWLKGAGPDYLFEKCPGVSREYDPEATFAYVKECLNKPVIEALNGHEHWMRHDMKGNKLPRVPGFRHTLQEWRRTLKDERAEGVPEGELTERPTFDDPNHFAAKPGWDSLREVKRRTGLREYSPFDFYYVPDCWEPWVRLWWWDYGVHWYPSSDRDGISPAAVLKREERLRLLDEVEGHLADQREAADVLHKLGFDDYYGSERYNPSLAYLYEALQFAAREIAASMTLTWGDPVC